MDPTRIIERRKFPVTIYCGILLVFMLPIILNTGCTNETVHEANMEQYIIPVSHAQGFTIADYGCFRILTVDKPWQGARNERLTYILAGVDTVLPDTIPAGRVIRTPVRSVVCLSTTHVAMLEFIDEGGAIKAISGTEFIHSPALRDRIANREIHEIGYDNLMNYELILSLNPDIILAYGVGGESAAWLGRLERLGMTVVMIAEYLEASPLAQAEWVKFIAHFFDRQELAGARFADAESIYLELAGLTAGVKERPVVMSGLPWRESWFVPGGRSNFATLINDAGGRYLWGTNSSSENVQVDIERVIERSSSADFWLNTGTALSLSDILSTDQRLGSLMPYRLGNVYNNNARLSPFGGNDYWESGIVNPHRILADMIHILHPELLPGHEPYYYRRLE